MKTLIPAIGLSVLMLSSTAFAGQDKHQSRGPVYDYAKVIEVQPLVKRVKLSTPTRECWNETVVESAPRRQSNPGGAIIGGLIGGAIGHQFGSGHGTDALTMAGIMVGSAIGNTAGRTTSSQSVSYPVERCEVRNRVSYQERINGYSVTYKYRGRVYNTRMPYDPGKRLKVRVDVRPAGNSGRR